MPIACRYCHGTGTESSDTGARMRRLRLQKQLTMMEVAERMGISQGHLSLMEQGKRRWSSEMVDSFRRAMEGR